jgi:tetratricopeptide (TPR) repeat protein
MTSPKLRVDERVILHLSDYQKFRDEWEVPFQMSQEGIGGHLKMRLNNVSRTISVLRTESIIEQDIRHVKGKKRRVKVFFLSDKGLDISKKLTHDLLQTKALVKYEEVTLSLTLSEVKETWRKKTGRTPNLLEILNELKENDFLNLDEMDTSIKERKEKRTLFLPTVKTQSYFFGREEELDSIVNVFSQGASTVVIKGIAGIGKTSLALQVVDSLKSELNIFWYDLNKWTTLHGLFVELGGFLKESGDKKLSKNLERSESFDISRCLNILSNSLERGGYLLIFDDLHNANSEIYPLFSFLKDVYPHAKGKGGLLMMGREDIPFYTPRDEKVSKSVRIIDLEGLNASQAKEMLNYLSQRGIEAKRSKSIIKACQGHPLFLELLAASKGSPISKDINKFISTEVFQGLEEEEKNVLALICTFRSTFSSGAVSGVVDGADILNSLVSKSLVKEDLYGGYGVNNAIRDFFVKRLDERDRREQLASVYYASILNRMFSKGTLPEPLRGKEFIDMLGVLTDGINILITDMDVDYFEGRTQELLVEMCFHGVRGPGLEVILENMYPIGEYLLENDNTGLKEVLYEVALSKEHPIVRSQIMALRAEIEEYRNNWPGALELYRDAIEHGDQAEVNKDFLAYLHRRMAFSLRKTKDFDMTISTHDEAIKLYKKLGQKEDVAKELVQMAITYRINGDIKHSKDCYKKAQELFQELNEAEGLLVCEYNLARLSQTQGSAKEFQTHLNKAKKLAKSKTDKARLGVLEGEVLWESDPGRARSLIRDAAQTYFQMGDPKGAVRCLQRLALQEMDKGEYEDALKDLSRCQEYGKGEKPSILKTILRKPVGEPVDTATQMEIQRDLASARMSIGDDDGFISEQKGYIGLINEILREKETPIDAESIFQQVIKLYFELITGKVQLGLVIKKKDKSAALKIYKEAQHDLKHIQFLGISHPSYGIHQDLDKLGDIIEHNIAKVSNPKKK